MTTPNWHGSLLYCEEIHVSTANLVQVADQQTALRPYVKASYVPRSIIYYYTLSANSVQWLSRPPEPNPVSSASTPRRSILLFRISPWSTACLWPYANFPNTSGWSRSSQNVRHQSLADALIYLSSIHSIYSYWYSRHRWSDLIDVY